MGIGGLGFSFFFGGGGVVQDFCVAAQQALRPSAAAHGTQNAFHVTFANPH